MEIKVPPERLRDVARQLERASGEVDALLQAMLQTVNGLTAEWAGAASSGYIDQFQTQAPRMREQMASVLQGLIGSTGLSPGTVLVWDAGHPDTKGTDGYTYGHVAVVESVQPDGVWVSQANWPGRAVMFIRTERLSTLHAIPPGAQPLSPEEFRTRFGG